jgi:diguanylate cyclase (GGDEF)-like protein
MLELIGAQVAVKLDLARAHEQIRELATTDGLTGLNNHRVFQQTFDAMLQRARRRSSPVCFLLTDIDKFKVLNDTYGHPFGDEVLKGVARVLGGAVRSVDLAARYGGEEFAVLLEDAGSEGGRLMAERIRAEVEALSFAHPKGPVRVTLSLGVAAFPADGELKTTLIERADAALYQAKHAGRNRVRVWADGGADRDALPPGPAHEGASVDEPSGDAEPSNGDRNTVVRPTLPGPSAGNTASLAAQVGK